MYDERCEVPIVLNESTNNLFSCSCTNLELETKVSDSEGQDFKSQSRMY